ncbi:trans-sialidase, partial [Trypanosoma cruzi]
NCLGNHRLPRVPTGLPQHLRGEPLQPFPAIAHAALFAINIRRVGHAAVICDLNSHHELRDGCSRYTTSGEDLAATPSNRDLSCPTTRHRQRGSAAAASRFPT